MVIVAKQARTAGLPTAREQRADPLGTRPPRQGADSVAPGDFGSTLRAFRARAGWSQNALAKTAGLDASYINRLERAEREAPTRETALALARALRLCPGEVDRLLFSAGHMPPSIEQLGPDDSTLAAVVRVLTDDRLAPEARADFRAVVETIADRWQRRRGEALGDTAGGAPTSGSRLATRPNSVAPMPVTGIGLSR